jgi:hypothetical protein
MYVVGPRGEVGVSLSRRSQRTLPSRWRVEVAPAEIMLSVRHSSSRCHSPVRDASSRREPTQKIPPCPLCLEHACRAWVPYTSLHCARVWCVFSVLAGETHLGRRSVFREIRQRGSPAQSYGCRSLGRMRARLRPASASFQFSKIIAAHLVLEAKGRPIYISHISNLFMPMELCTD